MRKKVAILGSTGSIGTAALDVISMLPDRFTLWGASANTNWRKIASQAAEFRPEYVSAASAPALESLRAAVAGPKVIGHDDFCRAAADEADIVLVAIVGAAGLEGALAAAEAGKRLALANKESLVMAGGLVMGAARRSGAEVLPVDSEHSALFQAMQSGRRQDVKRVIITASGGPFLDRPASDFDRITVKEALDHPTWSMGRKITIDSATMANKAFEIIEARWLFDLPPEQIAVMIHPESIIHSIVEFIDSGMVVQMSVPDMRLPIQYAFTYPERLPSRVAPLDLAAAARLTFRAPDFARFPLLALGFDVARAGGTSGAVFSAANEVAVEAFLSGRITFGGIFPVIRTVMDKHVSAPVSRLEDILEADRWARMEAASCL